MLLFFHCWLVFPYMDTPQCIYPIYLLLDILVVSDLGLLWTKLSNTSLCMYVSFLLGKYLAVRLLGHMISKGPFNSRSCQASFQSAGTILHGHQHCRRVPFFPHPHQHVLLLIILISRAQVLKSNRLQILVLPLATPITLDKSSGFTESSFLIFKISIIFIQWNFMWKWKLCSIV